MLRPLGGKASRKTQPVLRRIRNIEGGELSHINFTVPDANALKKFPFLPLITQEKGAFLPIFGKGGFQEIAIEEPEREGEVGGLLPGETGGEFVGAAPGKNPSFGE